MFNCEEYQINHLRLCPGAFVVRSGLENTTNIFIQIKDFSLGKEFSDVSEGKHLNFFEFLHPDLSIGNKMLDFNSYNASYDIWSLGIILYYLIYHQSPFCKEGKDIFSKTILRSYLQ